MQSFDPIEVFYSAIDLLIKIGMWIATPFLRLFGLMAAAVFALVDRFMGKSPDQPGGDEEENQSAFPQRVYGFFLELVSLPKVILDKPQVVRFLERDMVQRLASFFGAAFQVSFLEPIQWLASIAGVGQIWILSRTWSRIFLTLIPTATLLVLALLVWWGGRLNQVAVAERYLKLGLEELTAWEKGVATASQEKAASPDGQIDSSTAAVGLTSLNGNTVESNKIPSYCELLFRRVQLLHPQAQSVYVIGVKLIQSGSIESGRKMLRKIAPDDGHGHLNSHSALASSYLTEFARTQNEDILPLFLHHADIAAKWPLAPIEVLSIASEIHWKNQDQATALSLLEAAAERSPDLYLRLAHLATQAGDKRLASSSLKNGMIFLRRVLAADPANASVRIQIAKLLGNSPSGLKEAESLLKAGLKKHPTTALSRALSEVYRVRFVLLMTGGEQPVLDFNLLDIGLQYDPTNPLIAEQAERLISEKFIRRSDLKKSLNMILATGTATTIIHAILAEIHLNENQPQSALLHLEQVFRSEPLALKYSNLLTRAYLDVDRPQDALRVALESVELVQQTDVHKEKFASDLLDALGDAQQQLDQSDDAISTYEQCLQFEPNRIETRQKLAHLYRQSGQESNALTQEQAIAEISSLSNEPEIPLDAAKQ